MSKLVLLLLLHGLVHSSLGDTSSADWANRNGGVQDKNGIMWNFMDLIFFLLQILGGFVSHSFPSHCLLLLAGVDERTAATLHEEDANALKPILSITARQDNSGDLPGPMVLKSMAQVNLKRATPFPILGNVTTLSPLGLRCCCVRQKRL